MELERNLIETLNNLGVDEKSRVFLSENPIYQRVSKNIHESISEETSWGTKAVYEAHQQLLFPFVDYLTATRSMNDFREMQKEIIRFLILTDDINLDRAKQEGKIVVSEEKRKLVSWLNFNLRSVISECGIFSGTDVFERIFKAPMEDIDFLTKLLLRSPKFGQSKVENKIISLEEAAQISKKVKQKEGRVGYFVGKFRYGMHQGHIDTLRKAKRMMGVGGKLFVGIESADSIHVRRGDDHFTYPNDIRIQMIAEHRSADYVFLHNPKGEQLENMDSLIKYYEEAQKTLGPNFWIIGMENYHWRTHFEQVAKKIGAIVLWNIKSAPWTTTDLMQGLVPEN